MQRGSGRKSEVGGYGKFKNRPAYTGFGTPYRQVHLNTSVLFCIEAERVKESDVGPTRSIESPIGEVTPNLNDRGGPSHMQNMNKCLAVNVYYKIMIS